MPCFAKRVTGSQTHVLKKTEVRKRLNRNQQKQVKAKVGEDISEELFNLYSQERTQKALYKAGGGDALEGCRFGPDVIYDYTECTPIPLWKCTDAKIDFVALTSKESYEIIPKSPKDESDTKLVHPAESVAFHQRPAQKTPSLSWDITELEEDEFNAEAALHADEFKLAYCLPLENEDEILDKAIQTVQILRSNGTLEIKDRVKVNLTESKTEYHLHIEGRVVLDDGAEVANGIKERNEKYRKICQHHAESDNYSNRSTQVFLERERSKYTQLVGIGLTDRTQLVNSHIMFDEYNELKERERVKKAKDEDDAMIKSLAEQSKEAEGSRSGYKGSSEEDDDSEEDESKKEVESVVDWTKIEEFLDSLDDVILSEDMNELDQELTLPNYEEFDTQVSIEDIYEKRRETSVKSKPKLLPDISYSILILERIASTVKFSKKHMEIRGFEPVFKKELSRRQMYQMRNDALLDLGPQLKRYWSFKPNFTKGKEITSISIHLDGNLIAASYGSNNYGNTVEGLVAVWSLKNINFPERLYHFESSVTIVSFSNLTPYLLAIGLMDGNIFVYDIRSKAPRIFCTTEKMSEKHFGPVWDLYWLQETEMASTGTVNEVLISASDDGYIYRWTSSKGFEPWVLLKIRRSPLKIPTRRERRAEALISQWSATYTICFYPDDLTMYLIGTEEGFIHKCITSYTEQFVGTYVSHTGPVYAIKFSPFAKDIFISCSGDWSIKIWKEDFLQAPLLTIVTGLRSVFDVSWSPIMSSVFVCLSEQHMEIWDVTVNTLEPIIQFNPPNIGLRRIKFCPYIQGLIIGDDDGGLTVYSLKNFPIQPRSIDDKIDHLLEGLIPGYKKKMNGEDEDLTAMRQESKIMEQNAKLSIKKAEGTDLLQLPQEISQ